MTPNGHPFIGSVGLPPSGPVAGSSTTLGRAAPGGGLETWSRATPDPGGLYRHLVIRPAGGVWKVAVDDMVPAHSLPVDTAKQRGSF